MISKRLVQALASVSLATLVLTAHAAKPPISPDEFEGKFESCLRAADKRAECLAALLGKHAEVDPESIASITAGVQKWLGKDSVFKFHRIDEKNYADVRIVRRYLIEDTTGSLMAIKFQYRRLLGTMYFETVGYVIGPEMWTKVESGKL
jgi:hypothetical protein